MRAERGLNRSATVRTESVASAGRSRSGAVAALTSLTQTGASGPGANLAQTVALRHSEKPDDSIVRSQTTEMDSRARAPVRLIRETRWPKPRLLSVA